jgi:SAM-dependent methyltransferase
MQNPIDAALADPWGTMDAFVDGPLHPGGRAATEALLSRAGVGADTRLVDVGCGAGDALELARERGADAVGVDRDPDPGRTLRADMERLPLADGSADVVLSECVLCLSDSLPRALAETRRVLRPGGRLALSDVVVDGTVPDVPDIAAEAFCLTGTRDRDTLLGTVEDAGFAVEGTRDHREDLLAMRDELAGQVEYEGLLGLLGKRGQRALDAIETLETAVEDGTISYLSVVATAE